MGESVFSVPRQAQESCRCRWFERKVQNGVGSSNQRGSGSVPCTTLRIHPNSSGCWVFPSSTGSTTEGLRALIDWELEACGSFGVRMETTVSGELQRTRCHSLAGLRGLDSPPPSQLLSLCMHGVAYTAMRAGTHGAQEHPFVNMRAHRHVHTSPYHTRILLKKHIHRHA